MYASGFAYSNCNDPSSGNCRTVDLEGALFFTRHVGSPARRERKHSGIASLSGSNERKTVLASGVFDLLHLGHVRFLEAAKRIGGPGAELIVIVARDDTVQERKGEKPVMPENQRRALVESLKIVDEAILGYGDFDIGKVIERIKPDIIALGHDQKGMERDVRRYVEERGSAIDVVRIQKFEEDELVSSSKIKQKIIEYYKR